MPRRSRLVVALCGIFTAAPGAFGQQQPPPPADAPQPQQPAPAAPPACRVPPSDRPGVPQGGYGANPNLAGEGAGGSAYPQGAGGGSMFQAQSAAMTVSNTAGPGGGIAAISVFAVPRPQPKLIKAHDLITIIIREESEVSSQGSSDLKRSADLGAQVDQFVKLNVANLAIENAITGPAPSIKLNGSRNFKGEATVDRTDSVIARITAEVVDVKPNGTLVIQARKKIKTDEEEQTLLASGICRVEDITPDNTVLSTQLFDLEFTKINKGQVRNSTKTGGLNKLLDFLNPF
jgi:flagellar L-ring protein precursor FlgH